MRNRLRPAKASRLNLLLPGMAATALFVTGAPANANHSWNGYHWARSSATSFTVTVGSNVNASWLAYVQNAVGSLNQSNSSGGYWSLPSFPIHCRSCRAGLTHWRQSSPPARRRHSRPSRYRAQGTRPASCWRSDDPPPCIGPTCRRPRRGLATASSALPLRLTWESAASPARICRRILIVDMDDGPVLPPGDAAAGAIGMKPVRALAIAPPTGRIVEIGRAGGRREQGRSALALGSGAAPSSDAAAADRKAADPIRRMRIICARPAAPAEPPPCPWHSCSSRLPAPATWPAGFPPDHVLRTGRWRC